MEMKQTKITPSLLTFYSCATTCLLVVAMWTGKTLHLTGNFFTLLMQTFFVTQVFTMIGIYLYLHKKYGENISETYTNAMKTIVLGLCLIGLLLGFL